MPSMSATVNGWRCRVSKKWYPTSGSWTACSSTPGVNLVASSPTNDSTGNYSDNMYTVIIKVTMPSAANMDYISSITISMRAVDMNTTSGTMYGSLRTVDDDTSAQYSISNYRTYVAGGSGEQSISPVAYPINTYHMTFYGTFTPGESYYLWLYTKSSNDVYRLYESSSEYNCSIDYVIKTYTIFYNTNGGTNGPSSSSYEYNKTCTVSNVIPTRNPSDSSSTFVITGNANGGDENKSVTATKTITTYYTFKGWSTSSTSTTVTYTGGSTFKVTGNVTLYAVWASSQGTTYSNNTLADLPKPTRASASASYTLNMNPDNNSTTTSQVVEKSASYTFSGWSVSTTGDALDMSTSYTADTTVYAVWAINGTDTTVVTLPIPTRSKFVTGSYTVTLDTNDGSVSSNILTANINAVYTFMGWSTSTSPDNIVASPYIVTADTTLTAIWESESQTDSVILPSAVKDGYNFLGWSETPDSIEFVPNPYVPISDISLYANYKIGKGIKAFLWHGNNWYRIMVDGF